MKASFGTEHEGSAALLGAATALLAGADVEQTVQAGLAHMCALTGARYGAVGIVDQESGLFGRYITAGLDEAVVRAIGEPPRGRGVLGVLMRSPTPVRTGNIGAHAESYGFPLNHPPMSSFLGQGLWLGGRLWGTICVTEKLDGVEFTVDDEHTLGVVADMLVRAADPHLRAERAVQRAARLEQDHAAYTASNDIARSLAGQPDLDHMVELIVKRGRALTGARGALLALASGDGMIVSGVAGTLTDTVLGEHLPLDGTARSLIDAGTPSRGGRGDTLARLAAWLEADTLLVVPLMIRKQPVGVLVCIDRGEAAEFSPHDVVLGEAFGTSAAVAIATARSAQEQALQRAIAATERERAHWARELHDETLQELAAIKLLLGMTRRAPHEAARAELLDQAAAQIDAAAIDLRRLIAELRPATLDAHGLQAAIDGLVSRIGALGGLDVAFDCTFVPAHDGEEQRLGPEVEGVVYRVVQEALNNVARHSQATRAEVVLAAHGDLLRVSVSDNGRGFNPSRQDGGFGLIGMRERAELVSGDLRVESRPGGGTIVSLTVPIDQEA